MLLSGGHAADLKLLQKVNSSGLVNFSIRSNNIKHRSLEKKKKKKSQRGIDWVGYILSCSRTIGAMSRRECEGPKVTSGS